MASTNKKQGMHIAIAGNIGAGKTTLTKLLSKHYKWNTHFEDAEENPYLNDFYDDMQRWSFNLQIYFLNSRLNQIIEIRESNKTTIQDRTIYEDTLFAKILYDLGHIDDLGYENYKGLFYIMNKFLVYPDVIVYLRLSPETAMQRIQKRARGCETGLTLDYLRRLNHEYENWVEEMTRYTTVINMNWDDKDESLESMTLAYKTILEVAKNRQEFIKSIRRL